MLPKRHNTVTISKIIVSILFMGFITFIAYSYVNIMKHNTLLDNKLEYHRTLMNDLDAENKANKQTIKALKTSLSLEEDRLAKLRENNLNSNDLAKLETSVESIKMELTDWKAKYDKLVESNDRIRLKHEEKAKKVINSKHEINDIQAEILGLKAKLNRTQSKSTKLTTEATTAVSFKIGGNINEDRRNQQIVVKDSTDDTKYGRDDVIRRLNMKNNKFKYKPIPDSNVEKNL